MAQSLVPGEHGGVPFDSSPPLTFGRPHSTTTKRKSYGTVFQICSDHGQEKTRFGENELKIAPKLSTADSHTTELNKVL